MVLVQSEAFFAAADRVVQGVAALEGAWHWLVARSGLSPHLHLLLEKGGVLGHVEAAIAIGVALGELGSLALKDLLSALALLLVSLLGGSWGISLEEVKTVLAELPEIGLMLSRDIDSLKLDGHCLISGMFKILVF